MLSTHDPPGRPLRTAEYIRPLGNYRTLTFTELTFSRKKNGPRPVGRDESLEISARAAEAQSNPLGRKLGLLGE